MKGYKNALSSKDEADKYIKSAYGKGKKEDFTENYRKYNPKKKK